VSQTELTQAWEMENVMVLASVWEDAEGLVRKVALLEGEHAKACRTQEVAEEKFCRLSGASADGT
jgi:hypothetical protein